MSEPAVAIGGTHIAAASIDGVGIIDGTKYIYTNDALVDIHGYERSQDLVGQEWECLYTPDGGKRTAAELLETVRQEGDWQGRALGFRQNGADVLVELSLRTTEDGIVCVVSERTETNPSERSPRPTDDQPGGIDLDPLDRDGILQNLLDALADVIYVVDEEDNVVAWNSRLNERLGYTDEEIAEMSLPEFLTAEDREHLAKANRRMIDLPDRIRELEVVTKDDERIPHELQGVTYTDELTGERFRVGIARDITERKEQEERLKRYETIVETVDDGVYVLDENLQVDMANERFFEMLAEFGFSREEVQEMHAHDLVVNEDERAALEATIEQAVESEPHIGAFEMSAETPDGDRVVCESRFRLYPEPEGEHRGCIGILRDITDRKERERRLERQRDELDTLNRINELLLAVTRDLFESPMQGNIEQTVCSRLADSDLYQFAWIGKPEIGGNRLLPDASAGVDDEYVDSLTVTTDEGETGQGPAGRAFRTGNVQVSQDIEMDPTFEPWRDAALGHDIRSAAAIPLTHDGTTYGVLAVYASRPLAFSHREQRGFEILGEAIGHAINATRTRQLLFAEQVVELELSLPGPNEFLIEAADRLGCQLSLEGYVSTGKGSWLLYVALSGTDAEQLAEAARETMAVETAHTIENGDEPVVALTAELPLLDTIAALGGRVTSLSIANGNGDIVVEIPQSTDISEFIEQIRSTYPGAELLAKRDERPVEQSAWLASDGLVDLTDRQRQALEAAYLAGYFEWPRESTAEDVAALLDISRPTLQAHLRKAEQELLTTFLDGSE